MHTYVNGIIGVFQRKWMLRTGHIHIKSYFQKERYVTIILNVSACRLAQSLITKKYHTLFKKGIYILHLVYASLS